MWRSLMDRFLRILSLLKKTNWILQNELHTEEEIIVSKHDRFLYLGSCRFDAFKEDWQENSGIVF